MILIQAILRKKSRGVMICSKLYVAKVKYSKSLKVKELKTKVKPVLIMLQSL